MSNRPDLSETNPFSVEAHAADAGIKNPYSPTSHVSPAEPVHGDAESIRRRYIAHEASIKSIGILYMLGAIIMIPIGMVMLVLPFARADMGAAEAAIVVAISLIYLSIGVLQAFTAVGLRRLRPWARIVSIVLSVIGLLAFPLGTLISAYILYLLVSAKGEFIFSPPYQDIVFQTPHVRYKTSLVAWIALGVLLLVIAVGIVAAVATS